MNECKLKGMSEQYLKRIILKFKRIFSFTLKIKFIFMNSLWAEKNMFIYFHSTCMKCAKYFQAIHISLNKFVMLHKKKPILCFQGHKLLFFQTLVTIRFICVCVLFLGLLNVRLKVGSRHVLLLNNITDM